MLKTIQIIVMAMLCLNFSSKAQTPIQPPPLKNQGLMGKVIALSGETLPGAIIKIVNTNQRIITDQNGQFILSLGNGTYQLTAHYVGYKTSTISIQIPLKEQMVITLQPEDNPLNEVQIIGYGQTTKKLNTGSVSSITAADIEKQPVTNVLSALSGRMPGVFVQTTNGLPGGNINIQIRGKGSIGAGTDPLYIIDGMPYDGSPPNSANDLMSIDNIVGSLSPLNNLNPVDIESITVLKDADATSIYGSRGANGVVLIVTKKNKTPGTRLDVNMQYGLSRVAEKPKLMSLADYLTMRKEAYANEGLVPSSDPLSPNYAPDLTLWSQTKSTDWVDYIIGNTAHSTDVQAKLAGGNQNTTFSVNGNYRAEHTVLAGKNNYIRDGWYAQLQHSAIDGKLLISISNAFTQQSSDLSNPTTNLSYAFLLAPNYPLQLSDGSINWFANANLNAELDNRGKSKVESSISNIHLNYALSPQLNFKINAGYTNTNYIQTQLFPQSAIPSYLVNYSNFGTNTAQSTLIEPQVDYSFKSAETKILVTVGATYQDRSTRSQFIKVSNFGLASLMEDLSSAANVDNRINTENQYKYLSVFGRLTYNLNDSYILNATLRRDGSSRFGNKNRFGNFGAIGAAWIFSNISFIKAQFPTLSHGKFKASYGSTGNDQIADYQYLSTYSSPGSNIYQGQATVRPSRINNADFHWETTHKIDLGLELGFFNDRILLAADCYFNKSKDQLINYTLPGITGFSSYQANLPAVVVNKGWEFSATGNIIAGRIVTWSASFNLTLPRNSLKSFENFETSSYALQYQLGYDITRIVGYQFLRVDQLTGAAIYAGKDGAETQDPYFFNTLGKQTPDYYGGMGNNLKYGNFEINIFAQFVKQESQGGSAIYPGSWIVNDYNYVNARWSAINTLAQYPKASVAGDFYYSNSSLNIFDTSYLRLKNVACAYTVPQKYLQKIRVANAKVFLQGQNLFTIWNRNAGVADPESGVLANAGAAVSIPPLKTVVLGIQLTL